MISNLFLLGQGQPFQNMKQLWTFQVDYYYYMMEESRQEFESLSERAEHKGTQNEQHSKGDSTTTNLLTFCLAIFFTILLFKVTERIFTLSGKQEQMKELLDVYESAVHTLEQKIKILNLTTGDSFSEEDLRAFSEIKSQINHLQAIIEGKPIKQNQSEVSIDMFESVERVEKDVLERQAVIAMLVAHSKEEIRKKKIEMFEKIGKKDDFKQQKIRNPWAMSRLNLRTPFIDTLQRRHMQEEVQKESQRLQQKYRLSGFTKQLPICVVVSTRNNAKNYRYQYNLQSIINQNYDNYKIVIVDDASDDGTADLIESFLFHSKLPSNRYFLIRNRERMTAVPNINTAIRTHCQHDDIAVLISGDDEILGKLVFQVLNAVYQTKKPAMAYTNHFYGKLHENDFDKGYSSAYSLGEIKNKLYRFIGQKFGHMRTFPVSLFLQIKEQHMRNRDGTWVQATYDETFILPILEMACDSVQYIDEYVYVYNYGTGQNDGEIHHEIQSKAALYVRELPRYSCIEKYQKYVI